MTAPPERRLMRLTASQRKTMAQANPLIVLPVAAIEQHGPHLPVGTDALIAEILLREVCQKLGPLEDVFLAPPLYFGKSNEHLGFPGVLNLSRESLAHLFLATLHQLHTWGFRRVAILNTHGGNSPCLRTLIREQNLLGNMKVHWLEVQCPNTGMSDRECQQGLHAGEYETSILLAAVPERCKMDLADCQWIGPEDLQAVVQAEASPVTLAWHSSDLSLSGTMGDATRANAEKGRRWLDGAVTHLLQQLREHL